MIVAAIAWRGLDTPHRRRVVQLLSLNPDYRKWIEGVEPGLRDEIAFLRAATWPDAIKSDPRYEFDGSRPTDTQSARNIGYADHRQHRYWHYIDLPLSADGTRGPPPDVPNALTQIRLFRRTLRSAAPDGLKSYDLVWLEHLVGDIHQPLHSVSRFSRAQPAGDAGGNFVALCQPPCRYELHAFWDRILGTSSSPYVALRSSSRIQTAPRRLGRALDERVWTLESRRSARQVVYAAPVGPAGGPYRLDESYRLRALAEARRRTALAGARLAAVIEADLR